MIHRNKNFSRDRLADLPTVENGDTFENCNFTQESPHTTILAGYTGLTFQGCNLVNCDIPGDAAKVDCLHFHKSNCTHLHPNYTTLTPCPENCAHVVDTDTVEIDGAVVDTTYHYEDTREV